MSLKCGGMALNGFRWTTQDRGSRPRLLGAPMPWLVQHRCRHELTEIQRHRRFFSPPTKSVGGDLSRDVEGDGLAVALVRSLAH